MKDAFEHRVIQGYLAFTYQHALITFSLFSFQDTRLIANTKRSWHINAA